MSDNCKICGAGEGLHHFETMQCPRNGMEAPVGRKQEWQKTIYQSGEDCARAETSEQRVKELEAQIAQAKNDLSEYRAEIERLTRKAMTE